MVTYSGALLAASTFVQDSPQLSPFLLTTREFPSAPQRRKNVPSGAVLYESKAVTVPSTAVREAMGLPGAAISSYSPCLRSPLGSGSLAKARKILPSSVTANPRVLEPTTDDMSTLQRVSLSVEASTSMYWAAGAR